MTRDSSDGPRTISFWVIVAVAVVLFGVGIVLFVSGDSTGTTAQLDVSQRRPVPSGPSLPDGSAAPDGVAEVHEADGALTYALEPPEGWVDVGGEPSTAVAPVTVEQIDDGAALLVSVACAQSAGEYLAQVGVTESASTVTVMAVAVLPAEAVGAAPTGEPGPTGEPAEPCDPAADAREFRFPLQEAVGSRTVVVVPAGPVPG